MVYQWTGHTFAGDGLTAQRVGEALERLRLEAGGVLAAQDVVACARNSASPLHKFFQWDDRKAAVAHRIEQARELVRAVVVIVPDGDGPVPAFEPTTVVGVDGPAFKRAPIRQAFMPKPQAPRFARLHAALRELEAIRRRFADLEELGIVLDGIDELLASRAALERKSLERGAKQ